MLRSIAIDINTRKFLTVGVVNGDLPVAMLAPPILAHSICPFAFNLFHVRWPHVYWNMASLALPRK
jgi:hypothetical protein